jgi:hypothetical protein
MHPAVLTKHATLVKPETLNIADVMARTRQDSYQNLNPIAHYVSIWYVGCALYSLDADKASRTALVSRTPLTAL